MTALAYESAGGTDPFVKMEASAIAELFIAASYVLDHAMDDEVPPSSSLPSEITIGTTLLLVASAALDNAASHVLPSPERTALASNAYRHVLSSCAGQFHEILLMQKGSAAGFTTDDALNLTQLKAGSLGRLGGNIGSALASADEDARNQIEDCCAHYTTYLQLLDDLNDAPDTPDSDRKSDASTNKPSLPLVYLHNSFIDLHPNNKAVPESGNIIKVPGDRRHVTIEDLQRTGAELFTKMAAEVVRNRAISLAEGLEKRAGKPLGLASFVKASSLEHGSDITRKTWNPG
ncbi:MAG: class 1 isoprenoid biosynthesis enzyme [Dehalococcoidia bacterium]